jgi:hypothetical protein
MGRDFREKGQMYTGSEFRITAEDNAKIVKWLEEEVYPPIVEAQLKDPSTASMLYRNKDGKIRPYTGAIGGGLTYEFTPTSLGVVFKVIWGKGLPGEKSLDLTDYDSW